MAFNGLLWARVIHGMQDGSARIYVAQVAQVWGNI